MKKIFLALVMFSGLAFAQAPDCLLSFNNWTIAQATNYQDNRRLACTNWVMTYQVTGFSAISLQFESATGATTPGAFGAFSGSTVSGSNPSTSVACATVTNCTAVFTGQVGWYRLNLSSVTGSGTVSGTLKGYIGYVPLGGNTPSGSGCAGTIATPCVVDGPDAAGAAATKSPVLMAGWDSTLVRRILTDILGEVFVTQTVGANLQASVQGPQAANTAIIGNPLLEGWSDGANIQRAFFCLNQAAITISAGTDTVIVAGTAAKKTIICHLDFAGDSAQTFTIRQGTGSTCGTGTATVAGAYPSVQSFVMDYQPTAALRTTVNANDICLHSGGSVTVGGFVTYAQF